MKNLILLFSIAIVLLSSCVDSPDAGDPDTGDPAVESYNVIYYGNDATAGSAPVDGDSYESDEEVTVAAHGSLEYADDLFIGWNTSSDGSGTNYAEGDVFSMPTADVDLYAQWQQQAVYVNSASVTGGDGTFESPFASIAAAMTSRGSFNEIVLLPGTYDEQIDFAGDDLYVHSLSDSSDTIILPAAGGSVITFSSGETPDAVLEGVTVRGGTEHGIYIKDSSPTIRDCVIEANSGSNGAGVYAFNSSSLFSGNTISDNSAGTYGGGLYAQDGAITVSNNTISGNLAGTYGGGLYAQDGAITLSNNTISGNSVGTTGGGLYFYYENIIVSGNIITNNTVAYSPGVPGSGLYAEDSDGIISANSFSNNDLVVSQGNVTVENNEIN